jgi:hypothetical protein
MNTPKRSHLPAHLRAFLNSCIDSVGQLDALLLLQHSGQAQTARSVGQELGIADQRARGYLDSLVARGLARVTVGRDLTYSFRPASAILAGYCEELVAYVASARADVITFVAGLPPLSVRGGVDAFDLRDEA